MSEAAEGIRKGDVQVEGELAVQRVREVLGKRMNTAAVQAWEQQGVWRRLKTQSSWCGQSTANKCPRNIVST